MSLPRYLDERLNSNMRMLDKSELSEMASRLESQHQRKESQKAARKLAEQKRLIEMLRSSG